MSHEDDTSVETINASVLFYPSNVKIDSGPAGLICLPLTKTSWRLLQLSFRLRKRWIAAPPGASQPQRDVRHGHQELRGGGGPRRRARPRVQPQRLHLRAVGGGEAQEVLAVAEAQVHPH